MIIFICGKHIDNVLNWEVKIGWDGFILEASPYGWDTSSFLRIFDNELQNRCPDVRIIFDDSSCLPEYSFLLPNLKWMNFYSGKWEVDLDLLKQVLTECEPNHEKRKIIQSAPWLNGKVTGKHNCEKQTHWNSSEDSWVSYKISIMLNLIGYYSCFISYSSMDEEIAVLLYDYLSEIGVQCWFAPKNMKIGDKIRPVTDKSIQSHEKLLLILSRNSINSSWVEKEVETAFEQEYKQGRQILFPVIIDDEIFQTDQSWAADIRRTRYCGDLRAWKSTNDINSIFEKVAFDLRKMY